TWYKTNFQGSSIVGTGQNVSVTTPSTTTQYHVILSPYSGYGCPDTLTTTVSVSSLTVNASQDTTICEGANIQLVAGAASNSASMTYSWAPATGLSCTNCASPIAGPAQSTTYVVNVTDGNGCSKVDTIDVTVSSV